MKKLIAIIFAAAVLTACGGGGGGGAASFPVGVPTTPVVTTPTPAVEAPVCTVALFGDSILHGGYNVSFRLAIPPADNLKIQRSKYTVSDYSYNGGNAVQYLPEYLNKTVDSRIVVIEFGVNDAGNGLVYEYPMRQMLDRAKALNKIIIIPGIVKSAEPFARYNEYNNIAKNLASEYGATWAGWDEVTFNKDTDTMDGLHPTQEYSNRLVEALSSTLDKVAPECK